MSQDRVTIIGAGVSGLAAGIHLARQGFEVSLFEARSTLGGCCSTTNIDGFTFNNGAMFVAVPRLLDHAFGRLGLDREPLLPLRRINAPQATFLPGGTSVTFGTGRNALVEGPNGLARTAVLQDVIERCMAKWSPVLEDFTDDLLTQPLSVLRVMSRTWRHLPKLRGSLAAELCRQFSDPEVRAAIAAVTLYTGLPPERTPVFQIFGFISMLQDGLYLPEGGMGAISGVMHKAFCDLGGKVIAGTRVEKIRTEGGRVRALVIEGKEEVLTDAVISTAGGMATFTDLMDPSTVPSSMKRRVLHAPLSHQTLCIQLGLANQLQAPAHSVNRVPLLEEQYRLLAPQPAGIEWLSYTVPTLTMPELASAGGSIVEMFTAVDQTLALGAWDAEAKEAAADEAIAALARHHPLDVAVRRITSPKDYATRMNLFEGAVYGLSPAAKPSQQFPQAPPVTGLFLAGQTTYPGFGVAPAMFSGIFAADALIGSLSRAR
jgi:phytoene desaturase